MRVRKLDADGDYMFGRGQQNFLKDSAAAVAQSVKTRLLLMTGEWFLDVTAGTAWAQRILGAGTGGTYDQEIRQRVLTTPGVRSLLSYASQLSAQRRLTVQVRADTIFGEASVSL